MGKVQVKEEMFNVERIKKGGCQAKMVRKKPAKAFFLPNEGEVNRKWGLIRANRKFDRGVLVCPGAMFHVKHWPVGETGIFAQPGQAKVSAKKSADFLLTDESYLLAAFAL